MNKRGPENPLFTRQVDTTYGWRDFDGTKINATEVGSPCLRYVLRPPDGHRDVDLRDQGLYSFSAFGFRKDIGGEMRQKVRFTPALGGRDLVAYCADFDRPMDCDFFGVTVPGVFNLEVLDQYQQKPSLVGAAHLHMHTEDFRGAVIVGFNGDGSIMYVEAKQGNRREHDSVLVYRDQVVVKLGAHLTGMKRDEEYIFDVPRWAFSEDISAKYIVDRATLDNKQLEPEVITNPDLKPGETRLGHPTDPKGFANRYQGYLVRATFPTTSELVITQNFNFIAESTPLGNVSTQMVIDNANLTVTALDKMNRRALYTGSIDLVAELSEGLELLPFANPTRLTPDLVSDYAEYIYLKLHPLLQARQSGNIRLNSDVTKHRASHNQG